MAARRGTRFYFRDRCATAGVSAWAARTLRHAACLLYPAGFAPEERSFAEDNVRVIAVPTVRSSRSAAAESVNDRKSIFAITRPDVAVAYAMFARRSIESGDDAPAHVEFLIDRQGYLRARWIGVRDAADNRAVEMFAQIEFLNREPPGAPPAEGHRH